MARQRVRFLGFKLNRKNVATFAVGRECRDMCHDAAEKARAVAVSFSPRSKDRSKNPDKQHYAESFEIRDLTVTGITPEWPMTRAGSRVYNTADYATEVEWGKTGADGQVISGGHHVFGRTLQELEAIHLAGPT